IGAIGPPRPFKDGWHNSSIVQRSGTGGSPFPSVAISKSFKRVGSARDLLRIVSSGLSRGVKPPKTKASVRKTQSSSDTTVPPPTDKGTRLKTPAKGNNLLSHLKQKVLLCFLRFGVDEGTGIIPGVLDVPTYKSNDEENSWKSSEDDDDDDVQLSEYDEDVDDQSDDDSQNDQEDDDDDDQTDSDNDSDEFVHPKLSTHDEEDNDKESFDPFVRTPSQVENSDNKGNDADSHDVHKTQLIKDTHVTLTPVNPDGQQQSLFVSSKFVLNMFNPRPDTGVDSIFDLTPQLEAEVLNRTSNSSKTSYAVIVDSSEVELKKILIEKIERNKDTVTLKRRQDDEDKDEEPSAGSNRGSKRRQKGKETESTSAPKEKTSKTSGKSTEGSKSHQKTTTTHGRIQPWISNLEKKADSRTSFDELMDTPVDFSAFVMNQLKVDTLTPELLLVSTDQLDWNNPKGHQYLHDLLKPLPLIQNSLGHRITPFDHFINNDLEYLRGGASSQKYTTYVTKTNAADYGHIEWIEELGRKRQQFYGFAVNRESARDVYSKRRIIACMVDLQLGVEIYKRKLNLTKPDTYRTDFKRKEAYIAYSNPRGFIYQNKDNQSRLIRINELHKLSDGMLNDVRTALDNRLKGIQMNYLPQTIWRGSDKDRAAAMIQDIDKQLKTRKMMRSLEKFVGMSEGLKHGVEHKKTKVYLAAIEAYDPEANTKYVAAFHAMKDLKYPLWIRELRPSSSQLKILVYPKVRNPKDPWSFKEGILLEDPIVANISPTKKKKRCRVVCHTHGVGFAHHARSDSISVSVSTVAPQSLAIMLVDAATQTDMTEDEAYPKLLRSKSLPPMYNLDWP
nr:hypothetical protein [Tanacetum cinerariifolium]